LASLDGVIFDMDGVLIDSHPVHRQAWREFLTTMGKHVDDQELQFILEGRRREDILRHFLGELPDEVLAEYGKQKDRLFQQNSKDVQLVPGVRSFLEVLHGRGAKLAIATSASSYRTHRTLECLELTTKFSAVVTGDDVSIGKPDPAVYRLASERMNLPAENLLALEDAPCGVRSAKLAGIRCVGVSSNGVARALSQAGADDVIPDFLSLSMDRLLTIWHATASNDGVGVGVKRT
jgi:HAD superfamily hydrolase (TIGR01509 family)